MTGSSAALAAFLSWLSSWMTAQSISLWGVADLREFPTPLDNSGQPYPSAISMALAMDPQIMATIQKGPNQAYADEYTRVNRRINKLSVNLAIEIIKRGDNALSLEASERTDSINIKGDFPHKTAATRAGIGWIGRHCQLITRPYGSWVRLGTVFTDMVLPCGSPTNRSYCGRCTKCVDACPCKCLDRQRMVSRFAPGKNTGCTRMRPVEKGTLLPVPQRAQLWNLLGGLSLWTESIEEIVRLSMIGTPQNKGEIEN